MKKLCVVVLAVSLLSAPAFAGTKEQLIQLQTQVQALQDQMSRMQTSFDERMGVMRNLVEQTTDAVNKLNTSIANVDRGIKTQTTESTGKVEQVSGQLQALQDSVDELKGRLAKVSKQLEDMQAQQANLQQQQAAAAQAPPADVLYNNGLRDYNAAKYDLASQQFAEYLKFYGTTELAGNAQFYLADIAYRTGNYQAAVTEYDKVLEQYPGGNKTAAAQLKKGYALLELGQRDAGLKELRSLISRYPRSMEATQARDRVKKVTSSPTARR